MLIATIDAAVFLILAAKATMDQVTTSKISAPCTSLKYCRAMLKLKSGGVVTCHCKVSSTWS